MKPEKLILSAWGPYKDRVEVDFSSLRERGLFLITGSTGAGKTTIFDAITYALYGSMSGEQREKNTVRSDFASAQTPTYVELWMQHGGKEYHILRNPEYLRPKKKKGGQGEYTKEKEKAVLYLPDGGIIEGSSEVNRKLQDILVLDYRQFKQVSMIAQGEFTRLLTAPSSEKMKIFRELFSTTLYERFAGILRSRSTEIYRQIAVCRNRMEEDMQMLHRGEDQEEEAILTGSEFTDYQRILENLKERQEGMTRELKQAEQDYAHGEQQTIALTERIGRAGQINGKLEKLQGLLQQREKLTVQQAEISSLEQRLQHSRQAAGLMESYSRARQARQQQEVMKQKLERERQELVACIRQEEEERPRFQKKEEIRQAYVWLACWRERKKALEEADGKLRQKQEELGRLQQQYIRQEEVASIRKREWEAADQTLKRAAVGLVARQVKEGEPCPVCGSVEHPKIAETAGELPDEKRIQQLKKTYDKEQERLMEIHGRAAACQGEAAACQKQKEGLQTQVQEAAEVLKQTSEDIQELLKKMSEKQYEQALRHYETLCVQRKEKGERLSREEDALQAQQEMVVQLEDLFSNSRQKAGFASLRDFEEAILPTAQIERIEARCQEYYAQLRAVEELVEHLQQETQGEAWVDISAWQEELDSLQKEKKKALELLQEKNHKLQEVQKVRASLKEKKEQLDELVKSYGIIKDLDNLASGNNPRRLVFEQYVLAGYFEEILRTANLRLERMTGGRYQLSRQEEVSDGRTRDNLEIRILDYYTGKYRSVKTLSGGESFQVSLALALGMSDMIQGYSGGIRVDTLFIDEGFGALDGESLEMACQTLMSLVEKDRLIGIISHVQELAEKIERQIIVIRTKTGSTVRVW